MNVHLYPSVIQTIREEIKDKVKTRLIRTEHINLLIEQPKKKLVKRKKKK